MVSGEYWLLDWLDDASGLDWVDSGLSDAETNEHEDEDAEEVDEEDDVDEHESLASFSSGLELFLIEWMELVDEEVDDDFMLIVFELVNVELLLRLRFLPSGTHSLY